MAKLVYGLNQSLDGYVDHTAFSPDVRLFQHFTEHVSNLAGSIYGRGMYETMRVWDQDFPDWGPQEREFAMAWRHQPKWVVSRTMTSVGPNATLVADAFETTISQLKKTLDGEIDVAGPNLAQSLTDLGLIDEYRIYLHPVVLGHGTRFFAGSRPTLRYISTEIVGEDTVKLTYAPAY